MPKPPFDEDAIKNSLKLILDEIHSLDDPEELNELRRIFRKHVPLFSRAYVAGYLLKKARLVGANPDSTSRRSGGRDSNRPPREPREVREPREPRAPRENREPAEVREPKENRESRDEREGEVTVSRENMTTLFVGIGRTRRVYPRDLMSLLLENCGLDKDDIGAIKILDNYSFVDIDNDKAQGVIDTLGNFEFRGRPLNVNFAKKKE